MEASLGSVGKQGQLIIALDLSTWFSTLTTHRSARTRARVMYCGALSPRLCFEDVTHFDCRRRRRRRRDRGRQRGPPSSTEMQIQDGERVRHTYPCPAVDTCCLARRLLINYEIVTRVIYDVRGFLVHAGYV